MLVDQYGNPIRSTPPAPPPRTESAVQIRGGRRPHTAMDDLNQMYPGWYEGTYRDTPTVAGRYGLSRAESRLLARGTYFTNGLFRAVVDVAGAFLVGDRLTYGRFTDPGLQAIVEDFWQANSFSELMSERLITEWFLDGEVAVLFPSRANGDVLPGPNEPALIGMLDVSTSGFVVDATTTRGATAGAMAQALRVETATGQHLRWDAGEFAWAAHLGGLWNDPRGWSIAYPAADLAIAYNALMNMRLNVHHVQQRLLAVYKAILDPAGRDAEGFEDGGAYEWRLKAQTFSRLPEQGGVLPIAVRPGYTDPTNGLKYDGVSESIDFLRPAQGAADAASDMRLILRALGLVIGALPEHFLGEGGNATRTTAASMGLPNVRLNNKRQAGLSALLTRIFRVEVKRRAGPDARFRTVKGSRKRVHIDQIELPWVFPEIREESLDEIVKRVQLALGNGLISDETATADLGYDPALEADRKANQAPKPQPGQPTKTPNDGAEEQP